MGKVLLSYKKLFQKAFTINQQTKQQCAFINIILNISSTYQKYLQFI